MDNYENNRPGRNNLPLLLIVIGLLLLAGILAWQAWSAGQVKAVAGSADSQTPFPDIKRVSLKEAKTAFDKKSAVFVDVRSSESYSQGHIPGAINIPLVEMETRASELDPNQWIITYCT